MLRKPILRCLLSEIEDNVRSISSRNLKIIMLQTNQSDIGQLSVSDADKLPYFDMAKDEDWRTGMLQHLLEERRQGPLDREVLEWLDFLCCH